jgi:hypothetical protein
MARLDDLQFDAARWQLAASRSRERDWVNGQGDALSLMLCHGPPGVPVRGAAQAFGEQLRMTLAPAEGEVISVEERETAGARVIVAFASRPEGTGRTHTASIFVPYAQFSYTILLQCPEYGVTGVREALQACARWSGRGPQGGELETELDRVLPDHPHHRCRVYLDEILGSLRGSKALLDADPWPPSRLRLSGIVLNDRQLTVRGQLGGVLCDLPLSEIRRFEIRRSWQIGAIALLAAGLLGMIGAWCWLNGLWAGIAGAVCFLISFGALMAAYPWRLEIETRDGALISRELVGATSWQRVGLREHLAALLAESGKG